MDAKGKKSRKREELGFYSGGHPEERKSRRIGIRGERLILFKSVKPVKKISIPSSRETSIVNQAGVLTPTTKKREAHGKVSLKRKEESSNFPDATSEGGSGRRKGITTEGDDLIREASEIPGGKYHLFTFFAQKNFERKGNSPSRGKRERKKQSLPSPQSH